MPRPGSGVRALVLLGAQTLLFAMPASGRGTAALNKIESIGSAAALAAVEAGLADAMERKVAVCVVVLDEAGRFKAGRCMDGVANASFEVALAKAKHSADFRRPTKFQQDLLLNDHLMQILAIPGMLPLEGGVPIGAGGASVGAVGVSGAASEIDGLIAAAAAKAALNFGRGD